MTLESAIKHCEEVAEEQDKLCKRYDDASGYTRSHNEDIRTTDAKKCAECAKEHRQLAEWLKDYQRLLKENYERVWITDGKRQANILYDKSRQLYWTNCYAVEFATKVLNFKIIDGEDE